MTGFDDPGVYRPDRNLVQVLAFHRQKEKRRGPGGLFGVRPERLHHIPRAEIEPWTQIPQADRLQSVEITDRAFEPDRGRMHRTDGGKTSVATLVADDSPFARIV